MLARVLLVLLAGVPVCRGADSASGASYSQDYEADEDIKNPDFYNSYEEEIRNFRVSTQVTTDMEDIRLKRNDQEDIKTLNPNEIVDAKGILNDIMQGKQTVPSTGQPPRESTDSYEYLENSNNLGATDRGTKGSEFEKWLPTVGGQRLSPVDDKKENMVDTVLTTATSSLVTEQHWSFVYQPETSTLSKDYIIGEARDMLPEGIVPQRSTANLATTGNKEETESSIDFYPQETTTYSNSFMEAVVNNMEQNRSPASTGKVPQESTKHGNSEIQPDVQKWVQHWISRAKRKSTEYSNSEMQTDVKKLIQHWSPRAQDLQNSTEYRNSEMQADVKKWVQQWVQQIPRVTDLEEYTKYNNSEMRANMKLLNRHWTPRAKVCLVTSMTPHTN